MGKGTIISGGAGGKYTVRINYDRTQYDNTMAALDTLIDDTLAEMKEKQEEIEDKLIEISDLIEEAHQAAVDAIGEDPYTDPQPVTDPEPDEDPEEESDPTDTDTETGTGSIAGTVTD